MNKWLLRTGGAFNGFFTLFHILTAVGIQTAPGLSADVRPLLQMLNVGVILFLAFATYASFACGRDLLTSRLGKATTLLVALFYGVRAVEEIVLSPAFSPFIFGACLLISAVYVAVFVRSSAEARRLAPTSAGAAAAS